MQEKNNIDEIVNNICKITLDSYKNNQTKSESETLKLLDSYKEDILYQLKLKGFSKHFINLLYIDALIAPWRKKLEIILKTI